MEAETLAVVDTNGEHESSCNRPKTLPMKLSNHKSGSKNCSSGAAKKDCAKEGLENGLGENDVGDYNGDSEDEIIDVVYAFADYTIADEESNENQLSFDRGDKLEIISKDDPDWWWGKKNNSYGYIASNHVKTTPPSAEDFGNSWQDEEYFNSYSQMRLHMEMLEDNHRTDSYRKAIVQAKKHIQNKVVLDVGCGSGILSLFCAKYGLAKKVYAVEASHFAYYTKKLVQHNNLMDVITVIQGKVEDQNIPEQVDLIISEWMGTFLLVITVIQGKVEDQNIPEQVDLIISEWMGTFLLFEWMIECVLFARDSWLKESGVMWPSHAHIHLVPCTANKQMEKLSFWKSVHGFDFTPLIPVAQSEFFGKPVYNHEVEPGSMLARPCSVLDLDMKTVSIFDLMEITTPFYFVLTKTGTFHGFSSWFSVDFFGFPTSKGQEPIILDTGPDHPTTHWKQDLFMMDEPVHAYKGDVISGNITIRRNYEWKRHLNVKIDMAIKSKFSEGKKEFEKNFPIWR